MKFHITKNPRCSRVFRIGSVTQTWLALAFLCLLALSSVAVTYPQALQSGSSLCVEVPSLSSSHSADQGEKGELVFTKPHEASPVSLALIGLCALPQTSQR